MFKLKLQASEVQLHWKQHREGDKLRFRQTQEQAARLQQDNPNNPDNPSTTYPDGSLRYLMTDLTSHEVFVAAVSHLSLNKTRPDRQTTEANKGGPTAQ